jgi:hypothetical protein
MANPLVSPTFGNNGGTAETGNCPQGSWVNFMELRMGNDLEGFRWKCTDGQTFSRDSGGGSWRGDSWTEQNGFSGIEVWGDSETDAYQPRNASGTVLGKKGTNGGGSWGTFTCPEKTVFTGITISAGSNVNTSKFQCGYKVDCANPVNAFSSDCPYWCKTNPTACMASRNTYCSTRMGSDPQCKSLAQADPKSWIPAITAYCQGETLNTDSAFCAALCNNKALNGLCDTALETYCNPTRNPDRIKSRSNVCGCYMPGTWYTTTQNAILGNVPTAAATAIQAAQNVNPVCWLPQCATEAKYKSILTQNAVCPTTKLCVQTLVFDNNGVVNGNVSLDATCNIADPDPVPVDPVPVSTDPIAALLAYASTNPIVAGTVAVLLALVLLATFVVLLGGGGGGGRVRGGKKPKKK